MANLAGAGSAVVAGIVFTLLYDGLFGTTMAAPGLHNSLVVFMTSAGVLAGVWLWIAKRRQPAHPVARQLLAGACGFAAGMITLIFLAANYFPQP
ncbi:hypothetical protein [Pseudomonas triticicola]|nr:hypothetical protein [Pseudomonas triticicola]